MSDNKLHDEIRRLEKLVYVPGLWKCAKCNFQLIQSSLNAHTGAIGVRDEAGERCPNCDVPLWRVSERDTSNELFKRCNEQMDRAEKAETELEVVRVELKGEQERSRHLLEERNTWMDRVDALLVQLKGQREKFIGIAERAGRATPCDHERGVDEESGEIGCDLPECVCAARRETAARIAEGMRTDAQPAPAKQMEVA